MLQWIHVSVRLRLYIIRYESTVVLPGNVVKPVETKLKFRTEIQVPKVGKALPVVGHMWMTRMGSGWDF